MGMEHGNSAMSKKYPGETNDLADKQAALLKELQKQW